MLGRRPTLLRALPADSITIAVEAFKLVAPAIAVGAVGVGALAVVKLGNLDIHAVRDEQRADIQERIADMSAGYQRMLSDTKEQNVKVQQQLSSAFALVQQEQLRETISDELALQLKVQYARREGVSDPLALELKHAKGDMWEGLKADLLELRSETKARKAMLLVLFGLFGIEQDQQDAKRQSISVQLSMEQNRMDARDKAVRYVFNLAFGLIHGQEDLQHDKWRAVRESWQKSEEAGLDCRMMLVVVAVLDDVLLEDKENQAMLDVWQDSRACTL
ncbi:hypothetical protein B484DRAFT_449443 [Ochromonadaceae sp. CCMP2298]|nr:hypothetical protein B484DRAFT_449443 [Ochromonadaceae sp. CCMP2298]